MDESSNPLFFIVGPTASGKSQLALEVAAELDAAIVNADSVQVFQKLNIGTAKPSPGEMQSLPHRLFDFVAPGEAYTAGKYREEALHLIEKELPQRPLIFVGGSGFYIQALEKGMFDVGDVSDKILKELQKQQQSEGLEILYSELQKRDPEYADSISEQDSYRIVRALALMTSENRTMTQIRKDFSEQNEKLGEKYNLVKLGLSFDRDRLRERVRLRTQRMLKKGLLKEVKGLIDEGLKDWSPLKSVGYKECLEYFDGQWTESELVDEIVKNTMRLAKRQMTWFRRDKEIQWYDAESQWAEAKKFIMEKV